MSVAELVALKEAAEQAIQNKKEEERVAVVEKIQTLAKEAGFSIEELLGGGASLKSARAKTDKRSIVPPKYRDPATGTTWSGRGVKPKWVVAALASGKTLDSLKIS